jgi:methylenetetrahydrofolate dehydrogenase (NADP+)/methenyltetrahydrofolate cyclohydrolase
VLCTIIRLPATISQNELQQAVAAACAEPSHDGVLVQLPLPQGLDEEGVMEHLDPKKDVDGFHPLNMG